MSMVYCRGCGKQIHDSAVACPQCGAPQSTAADGDVPSGVKGWSWGAFLLNWVWAIGNRTWIGLLAIVPYLGFVVAIWLGFKGREMAWKNGRWDSLEHFNRVQRKWSQWGVGLTVAIVGIAIIGILAAVAIPAYGDYQKRARGVAEQTVIEQPAARTAAASPAPAGEAPAQTAAPASGAEAMPELISRAEFQELVQGRSADEILKALGQPQETQEVAGMQLWYYASITRDPATNRTDAVVQLMFENGYVHGVSFM